MFKFLEELLLAEGVLEVINQLFGLNIPGSIFIIAMFLILLRRVRSHVADHYPKDSFLYRRVVVRLVPNLIAIFLGFFTSSLFHYFEVPGQIRLLLPTIILLALLIFRGKKVSDR